MRRLRRTLLLLTIAGALASCGQRVPVIERQSGNVHLRATVSPAIAGERNTVRIETSGPERTQLTAILLDMPDMRMRPERVALSSVSTNAYESTNVGFSMAGTWRVTVLRETASRKTALATFDVTVR